MTVVFSRHGTHMGAKSLVCIIQIKIALSVDKVRILIKILAESH